MRRTATVCLLVGLFIGHAARAGEPQGKLILDLWEVAYLKGGKAGHIHTTVRQHGRGDDAVLRTTMELKLTVKRFEGPPIQLHMESGNDETPAGCDRRRLRDVIAGRAGRVRLPPAGAEPSGRTHRPA